MRNRDLGILLVAVAAAYLALQGQDSFEARRVFTVDVDPSHWKNHHTPADHERIPQPIIADLDGDGQNEFVVVTREPKLIVYESSMHAVHNKAIKGKPAPASHLLVKAETTLLSKARIRSARQPVAFAVGKLAKDDKHQYVAVLTHDWTVLLYDHNLKLIWEQHPVKRKMADIYHREASVIITTTNVRSMDRGLVVVGAAHDLLNYDRFFKRAARTNRKMRGAHAAYKKHRKEEKHNRRVRKHLIQAILRGHSRSHDALAEEAANREARESYKKEQQLEDLKHFSFYGMDGRTGAMRWKQENKDWSLAQRSQDDSHGHITVPQHNFKLDLHSESKHAGEVDWRQYRISILGTLPHVWNRREDTEFHVAHFSKRNKASVAEDAARNEAMHAREVGLFEAAPLPVAKSGAKEAHERAVEADKNHLANVLVAHTMHGIEVVHLYTGRTLCQLPLPPHTLNADINHDGALDRIEAIITSEGEMAMHEAGHEVMGDPPSCYGWVTTGFPPTHAVFNKTICTGSWTSMGATLAKMQAQMRSLTKRSGKKQNEQDKETEEEENEAGYELHAAMPALVARDKRSDHIGARSMQMHDLVFGVSDGTITSYTPNGQLNWQMITTAYWVTPSLVTEAEEAGRTAREEERHLIEVEPYAQVLPFPRQYQAGSEENVLAIGSHNAVLLGHDGHALSHFSLPDVPISPAVIGDFDSDGYTDVVVTTRTGYHGYVLASKSNHMLSFLLGALLLLLAFTFALTAFGEDKAMDLTVRKKRATD